MGYPKTLVISSLGSKQGPGVIGAQYYEALRRKGVDVDFLTKFADTDNRDYLYVYKRDKEKNVLYRIFRRIMFYLTKHDTTSYYYSFSYKEERKPPVPVKLVIDAINRPYDLVIVVFWQTLLSFDTIEKIFDKLHCQFQFVAVDYSPMSGGCHFTGSCERYKIGCGCCPAYKSTDINDFTAQNVLFRKRIYDKVKPIVYGNQYMMDFYNQSLLLKDARKEILPSPIIDTDVFQPLDTTDIRKKYNISDKYKYLVFFACQNLDDERKGIKYLIDALSIFYEQLSEDERREMLVMMAGRKYNTIKSKIPFESIGFGYIPMNTLPELFSMASVYVCSSVNDAGPMMVNQSLCCGTPVVGFEMGAVKQLVKNSGAGISVPLLDVNALSEAIKVIYKLPKDMYARMRVRCREIALDTASFKAQADMIINIFQKYKNL